MYVAVSGGLIAGFGHAVPGEFLAVYVARKFLSQGVGTLFLKHGIVL